MTFTFRPPVAGESPIFVMIAGGTGTGKSWSALRLLRGMVGPQGRIAALDTESGRLTNLRRHHRFDINIMEPPFKPTRIAEFALLAEREGFNGLLVDSMSMCHVGPGGYRDWHQREVERLAGGDVEKFEKVKWRARYAPSLDRQAMLYQMLQLRIPVVFSCRAREMTEMSGGVVKPIGWQPVIHQEFLYDMTLALTLRPEDGRGVINTKSPFKIEEDLIPAFRNGDLLTEEHGQAIIEIMRGGDGAEKKPLLYYAVQSDGQWKPFESITHWIAWWDRAIARQPAAWIEAARGGNGARFAEYAAEYPDEVRGLSERMAAAIARPRAG